jgi:hypothetical protein
MLVPEFAARRGGRAKAEREIPCRNRLFAQGRVGLWTWIGAAIIIASGLYIAFRERPPARRPTT